MERSVLENTPSLKLRRSRSLMLFIFEVSIKPSCCCTFTPELVVKGVATMQGGLKGRRKTEVEEGSGRGRRVTEWGTESRGGF